jgi:uncharacterized protein YdiU (UPF0061 family)
MNLKPENQSLQILKFDNRFVRELPADAETSNRRRQVSGACYSHVRPARVSRAEMIAYSREIAAELDLTDEICESAQFLKVFSGDSLLDEMVPYATCYGGHQFGNWAGQLGDGRAINLGEVVTRKGKRWALQLKGAGPTPYSRTADGFAVLRSSLREFLCSEAMYHLGVPTTRALSLILTGEKVVRDMFYNGNPKEEPGAVVCRVAPSFTRFGHFQIFSSRGEIELLRRLADYTLQVDFPHLGGPSTEAYVALFKEVCLKTVEMTIHWMRVGFVHGVMNTDNMSILGLTTDYGPYGWLENYDPNWTPNTTDAGGKRYRYIHQPQIAQWNLLQLAYALYPLINGKEPLEDALNDFSTRYEQGWQSMMARKLGLKNSISETDKNLFSDLLKILELVETDMTLFYRNLSELKVTDETPNRLSDDALITPLLESYYLSDQLTQEYKARMGCWLRRYLVCLREEGRSNEERRNEMNRANPKYVLRNYLAQLAIDKAEQGDYSMVKDLLETFRFPYEEQPDKELYAKKRPDWARKRAGCSMLSCSS